MMRAILRNFTSFFPSQTCGSAKSNPHITRPAQWWHAQEQISWDESLAFHREQLRFYLDYLIDCACADDLLARVEAEVKDRSVPDDFKLRFMVRALVRQVIEHVRECIHAPESLDSRPDHAAGAAQGAPALERLVYFMRDILEYPTRDTSLLIGISDAQVERLLSFARKRIDMHEGPSSVAIENPNGTYFLWKFFNLHPS